MNNVIEIKNLKKIYTIYDNPSHRLREILGLTRRKHGKDIYALNNVSFSVEKGKTIGIIGENGAGKSTLLKIITGVLPYTSGEVIINGRVSALLELGTGFNPEYTGIENIYLSGDVNGLTREEVDERIEDIMEFADIGDFVYQKVKTYSSGMFARLAFSVAIHVDPDILIVDEALSVGDLFFQQKCNMYMKEHMDDCTKILVSHDMSTIANMSDEVIVLNKGEQVFKGEPLKAIEYYTKQVHSEAFSREKEGATIANTEKCHFEEEQFGWIDVDESSMGGALDARFERFRILVNGEEYKGFVQDNDLVRIEYVISSERSIERCIIGYQVNDKYGNTIFGENTHSSGFNEFRITCGESMKGVLEFHWPQIQENAYFVTLGLGEGSHEMQHIIQCWAHNIFEIHNITSKPNHGLFNVSIDRFKIEVLK